MELPALNVDLEMPVLRKDRLGTGIKNLDLILEGGYKNPSNIMLIGPTGNEKMILAVHFLAVGLEKQDEFVVFISSDSNSENAIQRAQAVGIKLDATNFLFIDCYSSNLGENKQSKENMLFVPGPSALNDLSLALNDAMEKAQGKKIRIVFSSLSTFMLYNQPESILKFLQVVCGRLRKTSATAIFLVEEGVHEKKLLSVVEHAMDERFEIKQENGVIKLEIPDLSESIPIKVTPTGINIM